MQLHHVSIPYPAEQFAAARQFYGEVLELQEIPRPSTFDSDGVWFDLDGRELHIFEEDATGHPPTRRHFCFTVDDLQAVRARLEDHQAPIEEMTPIPNRPRFMAHDPAGNLLELTQIAGDYRA